MTTNFFLYPENPSNLGNLKGGFEYNGTVFIAGGKSGIICVKILSGQTQEVFRWGVKTTLFPNAPTDIFGRKVDINSIFRDGNYLIANDSIRNNAYVLKIDFDLNLNPSLDFINFINMPYGLNQPNVGERVFNSNWVIPNNSTKKTIIYFSDFQKRFENYSNPGEYSLRGFVQNIEHGPSGLESNLSLNFYFEEPRSVDTAVLFLNTPTNDIADPLHDYLPNSLKSRENFILRIAPSDFIYYTDGDDFWFCFLIDTKKDPSLFSVEEKIITGRIESGVTTLNSTLVLSDYGSFPIKIKKLGDYIYLFFKESETIYFHKDDFGKSSQTTNSLNSYPSIFQDFFGTTSQLTILANNQSSTEIRQGSQEANGNILSSFDRGIVGIFLENMIEVVPNNIIMWDSSQVVLETKDVIQTPNTGIGFSEWLERMPYDRTGWYTCYINKRPRFNKFSNSYVRCNGDSRVLISSSQMLLPSESFQPHNYVEDIELFPKKTPAFSHISFIDIFRKATAGRSGVLRGLIPSFSSGVVIGVGSLIIDGQIWLNDSDYGPIPTISEVEGSFIYFESSTETFIYEPNPSLSTGKCVIARYNNSSWTPSERLLTSKIISTNTEDNVQLSTNWEINIL